MTGDKITLRKPAGMETLNPSDTLSGRRSFGSGACTRNIFHASHSTTFHRLPTSARPPDGYGLCAFQSPEGLVNALVHRDYETIGGQVTVEIFPKHLIIRDPGKLADGWTEKDLRLPHASRPTNPDVARVPICLRNLALRGS